MRPFASCSERGSLELSEEKKQLKIKLEKNIHPGVVQRAKKVFGTERWA